MCKEGDDITRFDGTSLQDTRAFKPQDASIIEDYDANLNGLSHEIDFKNFDKNLQNLA